MQPINTSTSLSLSELQAYLEGSLPPEENDRVERHLMNHPEETDILLALQETLEQNPEAANQIPAFEAAYQETIKNLRGKEEQQQETRKLNWKVFAAIAAILIPFIGWISYDNDTSGNMLFAAHFQAYEDLTTVRSAEEANATPFEKGMAFYRAGDFSQAALQLSLLQQDFPQEEQLTFYLAVAQLANEQTQAAEPNFRELATKANSRFQEPANWYWALCYLQMEERQKAKAILEQIEAENKSYTERARKLLSDL